MIYTLEREQLLAGDLDDVFTFFSRAGNLQTLTPPWLHFALLTPEPVEMRPGLLIDYRLRLHGVPIRWTSRIQEWVPGRRFVDLQVRGPYRLWHHTHEFEARGRGTLVRDHVRYELPLGLAGRLAGAAFVRRDLERVFDYRRDTVDRLLQPRGAVHAG